jgi:hypothetical protein
MASGGFAKVYRSLWDGTLGPNRNAWDVFVFMLAHGDAGGLVDMTPEAIAARGGIPLGDVLDGISVLEAPDARSRSREEGGRRIVRVDSARDWGWRIVNYPRYRNSSSAERMAEHRWRKHVTGSDAPLRTVTPGCQAEAEADIDSTHLIDSDESTVSVETVPDRKSAIEAILGEASSKSRDKAEWDEGFREDFWRAYPRKVGKPGASRAWHRLMPDRFEDQQEALNQICSGLDRWVGYWREHETPEDKIPHPATFLNDHRHEDFPS